jgi:hypothetical protein
MNGIIHTYMLKINKRRVAIWGGDDGYMKGIKQTMDENRTIFALMNNHKN